ncbi:hypothetical protein RhiTH_001768 [Rhizoctonia solani]
MTRTGIQPRTNPDGDVDIRGVDFSNFVLPVCKACLAEGIRDDAVGIMLFSNNFRLDLIGMN